MNYGLRQRNAGYWQLSKRVHNTKELELSGKDQITSVLIFLRYEYKYYSKLQSIFTIFLFKRSKNKCYNNMPHVQSLKSIGFYRSRCT